MGWRDRTEFAAASGASVRFILLSCLVVVVVPLVAFVPARAVSLPAITDYTRLPGDQVVTVPNGSYVGGWVTTPHAATDGPFKGWLVLVAQSPHGVVVDLADNPLVLDSGASRVLFVGFTFVNGTVTVRGDDIAFWYTEHTFPIEEWNRQYQAAGANASGLVSMANALPKTIWVGDYTTRTVLRTQILGADIHDVGDDGVFVDHSQGAVIQGSRIWNIDKKTYDPGYNPWEPQYHELIHNDSVQIPGAVSDFTLADSYVGETSDVGGDNATSTNVQFNNLWIAGSSGIGFDFLAQDTNRLTGSIRDIRAFGNGTAFGDDPGWDQLRVDFNENNLAPWPYSLNDSRLQIASLGTNLNQSPPSGITMFGRRMVDYHQALNHAQNPANVWRVAHPYNSWASYFGFTGNVSSSATISTTTVPVPNPTTTTTVPTTTTLSGNVARVNAGGPLMVAGSSPWAADTDSVPSPNSNTAAADSVSYSTSAPIDMSDPSVPAGTPPALFGSERYDLSSGAEMQWAFPKPNGDYEVRLYFAEIYPGAARVRGRVFNVNVEGQALNNFDVYAAAGAANKAIVKRFTVHLTDGIINIDFGHVIENPAIQAIEIVPATTPAPTTATPPSTTGSTDVARVNAGGPLMVAGSSPWAADTDSAPSPNSNAAVADSVSYSTSAPIDMSDPSVPAGTPAALFQSERYDLPSVAEMQWAFAKPNGDYEVRLYFAEIYPGAARVRGRVFNVNVEGQMLNNFDVYAAAGAANKAIVKRFTVHLTDGIINIDFGHMIENPAIQAIEIVPQ